MIPDNIFRAYDIRGMVEHELTPDLAFQIGQALGTELRNMSFKTIAVGYDGRHSSPILSEQACAGLMATGMDVVHLGLCASPMLYFGCFELDTDAGLMITGSHNPPGYNGMKILIDKQTLVAQQIQALKQRIVQQDFVTGQGHMTRANIRQAYRDAITQRVTLQRPLKVVLDCGNGVGAISAVPLFEALGCDVVPLYCEVDGDFPNHHPDPSIPENMVDIATAVQQHNADIGLAFDGDADRLGVVTNTGRVIWPDRQMMAFAEHFLKQQPGAPIVYDVKCSKNLGRFIADHGGQPILWKTGHSLIKAKMHAVKSPFSGEMSGHLFFGAPWYGFDDGLYAGAVLCHILSAQQQDAETWFKRFPESVNTPELKVNIAEHEKFAFIESLKSQGQFLDATCIDLDGLRLEYSDGWGLVRASNTTACLTLRFEADNASALARIQDVVRTEMHRINADLELPF